MAFEIPIRKILRRNVDNKFIIGETESLQPIDLKQMIVDAIRTRKLEQKQLTDDLYEVELHINQLEQLLTEV